MKRRIRIKPYTRKRYGKRERVKGHDKHINIKRIGEIDLKQLSLGASRKENRQRLSNSHPDTIKSAKTMFEMPNKLWAANPDKFDILGFDAKEPPKVYKLPETGLKGQIVSYQGKIYIADQKGVSKLKN